jgi:hypothetical protein
MEIMHDTGMKPYSEQLEEYPEDVKKEYFELSEIAQRVRDEFGTAVSFDAIDAASAEGVWMTIRHRLLRTPAVLVEGRRVFDHFPNYEELRNEVVKALSPRPSRGVTRPVQARE